MSPEHIAPQWFGLKDSHPTKSSDCYALRMVIYETISGHLPFHKHPDLVVFMKVSEGKQPPCGVWFTDGLWEVVELCWAHQPSARPSVKEVLRYLGKVSQILEPHSLGANGEMCEGGDWDSASDYFHMFLHPTCVSGRSIHLRHFLSPCTISTQHT